MRFTTAVAFLGSAAFAAAQTTASTGTSSCAAQNILDTCLASLRTRVTACGTGTNDWVCLCQAYTDILTCYNNCPNDSGKAAAQSQVTAYCNAAAPILSASSASVAAANSAKGGSAANTATTATTVDAATTLATGAASVTRTGTGTGTATTGRATGTASGAAASSTSAGAGSSVGAPMGGAMALALGLLGML